MTGLEDFVECDKLELQEEKNSEKLPDTSSFVQKILYEDACAGVAVMDLFVAIKAVKENLDVLEERNNDFFEKIYNLNTETKVFMKEYEHLRYCITEFLNQMEGDLKIREVMKANRKQEKSENVQRVKSTITYNISKESKSSENFSVDELNPKGASSKEKPPITTTNIPEAMMVSFLAALVCFDKEQKRTSYLGGPNKGVKTKQKGIKHLEPHKPLEGEVSDFPTQKISTDENLNKKTSEGDANILDIKTDSFSQQEDKLLENSNSTDNILSSEDDDDIFDEALSSDFHSTTSFVPSLEKTSSVSCMGDLKDEIVNNEIMEGEQNESFVFKADLNPSKVWRLATDIYSKVMKAKRKKKEKVPQRNRQSPQRNKNTGTDSVKFTVSTNSSMGAFDITVVPHKKRRLLIKRTDSNFSDSDMTSSKTFTEDSLSSTQFQSSDDFCDPNLTNFGLLNQPPKSGVEIENHWTDKNHNFGFESANSDTEAIETYVDAFMEHPEDEIKKKNTKKGFLQELCLFWGKSTFFETFKCIPVYHSQCFTKKVFKVENRGQVDVSHVEKNLSDETLLSGSSGETGGKTMVIEGQSSDLVIYIQVEVESESRSSSDASFEYYAKSLGTQTTEIVENVSSQKSIKLKENVQEGRSLFRIWKCAMEAEEEKGISSNGVSLTVTEKLSETEQEILDLLEVMSEKEIKETQPEEIKNEVTMRHTSVFNFMAAEQKAHVWCVQKNFMPVHRGEVRMVTLPRISDFDFNPKSVELDDALKLIHEIESDIVEVKLSEALSMLPQLETELRKHVKEKLQSIQHIESKTEDEEQIEPEKDSKSSKTASSNGRLSSILAILSSLENAIKVNDSSTTKPKLCGYNSSTIFELLRALTDSIRQTEKTPTVTNLSRTIDLASRLDLAIRGEESEIKPPVEYFLPVEEQKQEVQDPMPEVISEQNLKNTRRRIFQQVENEAAVVEDRLGRDFERLDRLEKENDELLMFLEAFLQKTERRVSELGDLKERLKNLSSTLGDVYETLKRILTLQEEERNKRNEAEKRLVKLKERNVEESSSTSDQAPLPLEQFSQEPTSVVQFNANLVPSGTPFQVERFPSSSVDASTTQPSLSQSSRTSATVSSTKNPGSTWEPIRETVSGLLEALNNLKLKALEKKQFYMDILKKTESNTSRESQRSSVTSLKSNQLSAKIKKFKKFEGHSCYMAWSKPKGLLEEFIEGYHIYVNGKINHKVRNPERHQAILYSADFKHKADIQLYAITENFPKILLATYTYRNE